MIPKALQLSSAFYPSEDAYGVLDHSFKGEAPFPRNDEVGRIEMKVAVGAAEEKLKRVKSNFAEKIAKVKKR